VLLQQVLQMLKAQDRAQERAKEQTTALPTLVQMSWLDLV
jgi:hypothetical protein